MQPVAAAMLVAAVAGCSSTAGHDTGGRSSDTPNFLAGCGPLTDQVVATTIGVNAAVRQPPPASCLWTGADPAGEAVNATYAWSRTDTLAHELEVATQHGYRTEKFVQRKFGGFYWHDPRDAGSCGVSAADTGVVTWWVHNLSRAARPDDPCAAALALMRQTLLIDGT